MKNPKYGVVPKRVMEDKSLSLGAKGLYAFLCLQQEDWRQDETDNWDRDVFFIAEKTKDDPLEIYSYIEELEQVGYLRYTDTSTILI